MNKIWIVVANSSESKIYRAENRHTLVEHGRFYHDESRLPASDLVSDRPGCETYRGAYGGDTMQGRTPLKTKEGMLFAHQLAQYLERECEDGKCEHLYIVAKASFLGYLREVLHPNVAKLVKAEINKDLTHLKPEEILEYLPPVL